MPGGLEHDGDAAHIVAPVLARRRLGLVEVEADGLVHQQRVHAKRPVASRRDRRIGRKLQRRRQHEAVIIVGVLADQVDPAGRAIELRLAAELRLKIPTMLAGSITWPLELPSIRVRP